MGADRRLRPARSTARAAVDAEVCDVDVRVGVGRAAAAAVLRIRGVGEAGRACRGWVLDAEVDRALAPAPEVRDQRVVGIQDQRCGQRRWRARPSARRSSRARRSGRVDRETGCPGRVVRGASALATESSQNSSTSNRPSCCIRADARAAPRRRRRPCSRRPCCARLECPPRRGSTRRSRQSSSCRWSPRRRRCPSASGSASRAIASESIASISLPGRLVPPRPLARRTRPAVRASAARGSASHVCVHPCSAMKPATSSG